MLCRRKTVEGEIMQWKEIEGRWNELTSQVKCNLGELTNDHIAMIVADGTDDAQQPPGEPIAQKAAKAGPEKAQQADATPPSVPPPQA